MKVETINLAQTSAFSSFFIDYLEDKKELRPFYGLRPEIEHFDQQIKKKNFSSDKRNVLVKSLRNQYGDLPISQKVNANIDLLQQENTFTVTTGHQLNIFTGPLYFIYKIATAVNACKQLKEHYPEHNFVPVYWMASEDHDFEEISYFNLFGKKYTWESDEKGAVGRFSPAGLLDVLETVPEKIEIFEKAYRENDTLSAAVRQYVNELFGNEGIVVIDGDDHDLKGQFESVLQDDLFNHRANDLVEEASAALSKLGYKTQIFPRAINLFYLGDQMRERIIKEESGYRVNNSEQQFTAESLQQLIKETPEKLSPNVVLRPLYQETILPNLAYIGGPAEVVYWLQLKGMFDHYETPFPILMPRNFALYVNKPAQKKITKFNLTSEDLFKDVKSLKQDFVSKNSDGEVQVDKEKAELKVLFDALVDKASSIDGSLSGFIGAEYNKALKGVENIEKRLKKSEEQKHETALNQLEALKQKLFPGNGLQERHDNFLNFYLNNPNFIEDLIDNLDPFDYSFFLLKED